MKTVIDQLLEEITQSRETASNIFKRSANEEDVSGSEFEQADFSEAYADGLERAIFLLKDANREEQLLRSMRIIAQMWQLSQNEDELSQENNRSVVTNAIRSCLDVLLDETKIEELDVIGVNAWVIAIDETSDWNIPEKYQKYIERIESVYVYDKNLIVHVAEITGSRELHHVETRPMFKEEWNDNDPMFEEIEEWVKEPDSDPVIYIHCGRADTIKPRGFVPIYPREVYDDRNEEWKDVLEFCRCNEVI